MKKISEKILFEGNWLLFKESTFLSHDGKEIMGNHREEAQWNCFNYNSKAFAI